MLKKLSLENFTTFQHAEFNFAKGINIIIGENSSGKSHVLKLAYSAATTWEQCGKTGFREQLVKKLHAVFGIDLLSDLKSYATRFNAERRYNVTLEFFVNHKSVIQKLDFDFNKPDNITFNGDMPHKPILNRPIFFPAKEVLSIFPNFISLYEKFELSFDETYYDLCKALDSPLLKEPNQSLIDKLESIMGGKIIFRGNNFYLKIENAEMNIFMVAEGWRKLGMLSYLIANDSLKENSILFWDEPETNLNPRLIKQLAAFLVELSQHNIQIVIATHSLFLMKYFDFLIRHSKDPVSANFFNLIRTESGVSVEQGERLNQLTTIVALEEELELYDNEQSLLYS